MVPLKPRHNEHQLAQMATSLPHFVLMEGHCKVSAIHVTASLVHCLTGPIVKTQESCGTIRLSLFLCFITHVNICVHKSAYRA